MAAIDVIGADDSEFAQLCEQLDDRLEKVEGDASAEVRLSVHLRMALGAAMALDGVDGAYEALGVMTCIASRMAKELGQLIAASQRGAGGASEAS